ncbi:MAG TPA: iron-sulfur cluster assembly accessory protein, partial [Aquificaceae bacterium]|nr:iron-sulfur cluster assembly accessory protein [Aquificaceae bacterium]
MQKVGFNFFATDKAVQEVLRIAQENNITEPILRIRVVPGGCSGFQYAMGFDDTIEEGDNVFEFGGLKIVIDQ